MRFFARGEDILSYVYIATWNSKNLSTIPSLILFRPPPPRLSLVPPPLEDKSGRKFNLIFTDPKLVHATI